MSTPILPPLSEMLANLIASNSISSANPQLDQTNQPVITQLATWFETLGFQVDLMPVHTTHNKKLNLIARYGEGTSGLVLAGHTDTVPCDEHLWQSNPFQLTERDDAYFGLGICDMKGFFPLIIEAVKPLLAQKFQSPLVIVATADEETSMDGARALVDAQKKLGRFALIGEPTNMKPINMHKGIMMERVSIHGSSGHSSDPSLGNNALDAMYYVLGDLMQFRQQLASQFNNPLFTVPTPTMNLGCIHGGDNPNRICGSCELAFDLRPLPGMKTEDLRDSIRKRLALIAEQRSIDIELNPLFPSVEAFETPAQSQFVQYCQQLTQQQAESVAFATEAPFLRSLGMDTVVLGPGDIARAHQPDECLPLSRINPFIKILQQLIHHYCIASPGLKAT
ncbi:acetylornithine deacetylase [Zooshikella harenae]|uniref:Acetylornithine deacetylase n=1 Tax=Zooshikella harenae TaxID=2827238 RepID=A0ABS5ZCL1_9GAMM|nr:acetylornithine deacetylase [Zooshikella harenae]MBU2710667.1 acetylornithine deacetylase [Zooshikella harenae]